MNNNLINKLLSDAVYGVDKSRTDIYNPIPEERYPYDYENIDLGEFHVIKTKDDLVNGMQAMAIAPVVNGVPDKTRITIVYAGTNMGDMKDLQTGFKSVILGTKQYNAVIRAPFGTPLKIPTKSQIETAHDFANMIKTEHPNATIEVTGHLLGDVVVMDMIKCVLT